MAGRAVNLLDRDGAWHRDEFMWWSNPTKTKKKKTATTGMGICQPIREGGGGE